MPKIWGIPALKIKSGPKWPNFDVSRQLRNLMTTSTANVFGIKQDTHIDNRGTTLVLNNKGSPTVSQNFTNVGTQTA